MAGAQFLARARRDPGSERGPSGRAHADARLPGRSAGRDALRQGFRHWRERRVGSIRLTYPDRTIRVARGFSVLEASLINNIPHAHVCGGRGRCSTCRIRILGDLAGLPVPSAAEQAVLERVHAAPGIRLACQLRPTRDIAFAPMLSPYATAVDAYRTGAVSSGVERYVVIMFVDMRGSSRLAERRLPYDTVFIINQFLNAASSAVLSAGGEPNQVLGDGLLALFGMGDQPESPAGRRSPPAPRSPPESKA
jgi:adenylate cyclase